MTNSHLEIHIESNWAPVLRPKRGAHPEVIVAFWAYMLLPGFSIAFHAETLDRSCSSVASYRAAAKKAANDDPTIWILVKRMAGAITAEHGMQMAQRRGRAQLPFWSRLAMFDYRKRGLSRREIARNFCCSTATVTNVLQGKGRGYDPLTGERILTLAQKCPPARWLPEEVRQDYQGQNLKIITPK